MAILLPHSIFIHVPKTGGNWVEIVLRKCGLIVKNTREMGQTHATLAEPSKPIREWVWRFPSFAFVRHPLIWWRSYWKFKIHNGWDLPNSVDRDCHDPTFEGFIEKVLRLHSGHLTRKYRYWTKGVTNIGHTETLRVDLARILSELGETFDPRVLSQEPFTNVSNSNRAKCSMELWKRLAEAEKEAVQEWGYDATPIPLEELVK